MKKSQKLAIKSSIKALQEVIENASITELLVESILTDAFPEIAAELETPIEESKDQLKFDFALDKNENKTILNI